MSHNCMHICRDHGADKMKIRKKEEDDDYIFFSRVHATLHPALSVGLSVGLSVCLSVGHILLFLLILFYNVIFSHSKSF